MSSASARRAQTAVLLRQLLSLRGRLRRRGFWLTLMGFVVAFATVQYLAVAFSSVGRKFESLGEARARVAPVGTAMLLLLAWPATAMLVRRGQDRGYPGAHTLAVWGALVALGLLAPLLPGGPRLAAQVALLLYLLVDYGALPGVRGPNAYGPDPRAPAPAPRA